MWQLQAEAAKTEGERWRRRLFLWPNFLKTLVIY
jgi:hypothetical protein